MKMIVRSGALAAAVVSVLVACGSGAAPAATPGGSSSARTAAPSTVAPSPSSVAGATASAALPTVSVPESPRVPVSSLPAIFSSHADPALEALLPATVTGIEMTRYSVSLTQLLDAGGDRPGIDAFLLGIGKSEADGSYAAAFDINNQLAGGISAFKVAGAPAEALLAGITEVQRSDLGAGAATTQATVGNKAVTVVSVGSGVNDTQWIYGHGDVVFVVQAPDEAGAAVLLAALP